MEEKPSYYSILTADVRYDKRLNSNEKLLYSEITALMQKSGVCWANNRYFADLYEVSKETVSRWINHLFELNYICVQITRDYKTKEIIERTITLPTIDYQKSIPIDKNINTPIANFVNTPIDKNIKDNNIKEINITSNNITSNNISPIDTKHKYGEYKNVLLKDSEIEKLKQDYPENNIPSYEDLIKYLDEYIEMKGYKAKSHYLAIKKWVVNACKEEMVKHFNKPQQKKTADDFMEKLSQKWQEENEKEQYNEI